MSGAISFNLSPAVLEWARVSMGYTVDEAAKKAGVPSEQYLAWETGQRLPTYRQLEGLADNVFRRPLAILMLAEPPKEESINNEFRSLSNAQLSDLPPEVRLALRKGKRYQEILREVASLKTEPAFALFQVQKNDDPQTVAGRLRVFLQLSLDEQRSWKPEDSYRNFQNRIESIGIYVFKIKMPMPPVRAFCLTGDHPLIVLNTEDSNNGRIFSLIHETIHILLDQNDIFTENNNRSSREHAEIENFCNKVAAAFLVPDDAFALDVRVNGLKMGNVADESIQRLARSYNVSNEVIARKLLFLRLIHEDYFWERKRMWDNAARAAKEKRNEALKDKEGGIDQSIKIVYEKGRPYVSKVIHAYEQGLISSADLSNYLETKLKNLPKINDRLNS